MNRLFNHMRGNAVAYVALFVALGGSSYAAFNLPNHSITPVKLNPREIGGYTRAWASVGANGRVAASGGGVRVLVDTAVAPGHYIIDWSPRPSTPCTATGSVGLTGGALVPGYVIAGSINSRARGEQTVVQTYNSQGQPTPLMFNLDLICATPR